MERAHDSGVGTPFFHLKIPSGAFAHVATSDHGRRMSDLKRVCRLLVAAGCGRKTSRR